MATSNSNLDFSRLFRQQPAPAPKIPDPAEVREREAAKAYVQNMHKAQAVKNDLLDGINRGIPYEELLLMACEVIGYMSNDTLFYRRIKESVDNASHGQKALNLASDGRAANGQYSLSADPVPPVPPQAGTGGGVEEKQTGNQEPLKPQNVSTPNGWQACQVDDGNPFVIDDDKYDGFVQPVGGMMGDDMTLEGLGFFK